MTIMLTESWQKIFSMFSVFNWLLFTLGLSVLSSNKDHSE